MRGKRYLFPDYDFLQDRLEIKLSTLNGGGIAHPRSPSTPVNRFCANQKRCCGCHLT